MPRKYTKEALDLAVRFVKDGVVNVTAASIKYGVPYGTLYRRVSGRVAEDVFASGPRPILGLDVELEIKEAFTKLQKIGRVKMSEVLQLAGQFDAATNHPVFKNGLPSHRWYQRFLKRHNLSLMTPKNLSVARAASAMELALDEPTDVVKLEPHLDDLDQYHGHLRPEDCHIKQEVAEVLDVELNVESDSEVVSIKEEDPLSHQDHQHESFEEDAPPMAEFFRCSACSADFLGKKELKKHISGLCSMGSVQDHEAHLPTSAAGRKNNQCGIFDKEYDNGSQLHIQMATHTGETKFQCTQCDKTYASSSSLYCHQLTHADKSRFQCKPCGKEFVYKGDRDRHLLTHSRERKRNCAVCGERMKASAMLGHMAEHTGARGFECHVCKGVFLHNYSRAKHMVIHKRDGRYKCGRCGERFRFISELNRHDVAKHGGFERGEALECALCGKEFVTLTILKLHLKMHARDKKFQIKF